MSVFGRALGRKIPWILYVSFGLVLVLFWYHTHFSVVQRSVDWKTLFGRSDPPVCKNCNVIIISLDTLSANHLPCYGYDRDTAPNLCALAQKNIIFKNSYTDATWTLPSDVSMFTSLYPEVHKITDYDNYGLHLAASIPTLPEILSRQVYRTYLGIPLDDRAFPVEDVYDRGITKVIGVGAPPQENLTPALLEFLTNVSAGHKTFLFLHTYALHAPYLIEDRKKLYTTATIPTIPLRWSDVYDNFSEDFYRYLVGELSQRVGKPNTGLDPTFFASLAHAPSLSAARLLAESHMADTEPFYTEYYYLAKINTHDPRQVEYVKALYDQKIHELDAWIGDTLIPFLNTPSIRDHTIVIITSEHGEEFMEHGRISHETLYDSNAKVPLIMIIPGVHNKVIDGPVTSVDIAPTVLGALGIEARTFAFQGVNLWDTIVMGLSVPDRLLIANSYNVDLELKTVRTAVWKLFLKKYHGAFIPYELYNIARDPSESNNLLTQHLTVVNTLLHELLVYEKRWQVLLSGTH